MVIISKEFGSKQSHKTGPGSVVPPYTSCAVEWFFLVAQLTRKKSWKVLRLFVTVIEHSYLHFPPHPMKTPLVQSHGGALFHNVGLRPSTGGAGRGVHRTSHQHKEISLPWLYSCWFRLLLPFHCQTIPKQNLLKNTTTVLHQIRSN